MQVVGPIDVVTRRVPLVEIDAAEVDDPEQRRQVVDHRKVDDVARVVIDPAGANPVGPRRRRALHEEELAGGAVRVALHHHRAIADVRQQDRRDVGVVLNQIALGDRRAQARTACPGWSAARSWPADLELELMPDFGMMTRVIRQQAWHGQRVCRIVSVRLRAAASADAGRGGRRPHRHVGQLLAAIARSAAAGRRGSCRRGRRSRSGNAAARRKRPVSTSTYFARRDAAEQDDVAVGADVFGERARAAYERTAIARIVRRRCRRRRTRCTASAGDGGVGRAQARRSG